MKKIVGVLIILSVLVGGWYWSSINRYEATKQEVVEVKNEDIVLRVDFGDDVITYENDYKKEVSVLELLKTKVGNEYELEIEEYDFGSLVMSIDGKENTAEKSWIYFVNGKSGDMGADKKIVESGDLVEWKYIKPIF